MNEYQKIALEARKKVSALTLDQQRQLLRLYEDSISSLASKAAAAKDKSLTKRWLLDYSKELDRAKKELAKELEEQIRKAVGRTAMIASGGAYDIMGAMFNTAGIDTGDHFISMFSKVQKSVVKDIISGGLYNDNKTLSKRVWGISESFKGDIQYIINRGLLEKKSAIELAKDLEKFVVNPSKRGGEWGKVYPRLRTKEVRYNALRLARTSINHSYQTSTVKSSAMNPFIQGFEWRSAQIHSRTCALCIERATSDKYGLGPGIFPTDELPLDHPNGLCTILPYIPKDLDTVAGELRDWLDGGENETLDEWYNEYGDYFAFKKGKYNNKEDKNSSWHTKSSVKSKKSNNNIKKYDIIKKEDTYNSTKEAYKKVSYRSIDKDYAKLIDDRFLDLQNKYPINKNNIEIKALAKNGAFGYSKGQIIEKKGILYYVDEIVISNKNMKNASISNRLHKSNYIGRGSKLRSGLATVDHEYAHAIDNYYLYKTDSYVTEMIDKYRKGITFRGTLEHVQEANRFNKHMLSSKNKMSYEVFNKMKSELDINDSEMNKLISKELGTYAATSKGEFLAEGFANIRILSENDKTDFIRLFEKTFNEIFNEVIR